MYVLYYSYVVSYIVFKSTTVISEPDDVTVCEGEESTTFTCILNSSIRSGDVQWYRSLKDTGTTEKIGRLDNNFIVVPLPGTNIFTISLSIFNARKSYTGYYWVSSPVGEVCNTTFTVSTGSYSYVNRVLYIICTYSTYIVM